MCKSTRGPTQIIFKFEKAKTQIISKNVAKKNQVKSFSKFMNFYLKLKKNLMSSPKVIIFGGKLGLNVWVSWNVSFKQRLLVCEEGVTYVTGSWQ